MRRLATWNGSRALNGSVGFATFFRSVAGDFQ